MRFLSEVTLDEAAQHCLLNTRVRQFMAFIPFDNDLNVDVSQWSML